MFRCAVVLAMCAGFAIPAAAQSEFESDVPRRDIEAGEAAQEAALTAAEREFAEGRTVTFAEVLADPDNLQLNFRYAKTQFAEGNLLGAASTLERMLLINPDLIRVRLFYAIVLLRIDNLEETERELAVIRDREMPEALQAQLDDLYRQIRLRRRFTRFTANLTLGYGLDTNRNAAASSKRRLSSDTPVALTGTSKKRRDTSMTIIQTFGVTHDLGFQEGHQVTGSFTFYQAEQTAVDNLDLATYTGDIGAVLNTPFGTLIPKASHSVIMLSRETFQVTPALSARLQIEPIERVQLYVEGRWAHEDFNGIVESTTAFQRKGDRVSVSVGGGFFIAPTMKLDASFSYEDKGAAEEFFQYDGFDYNVTNTWFLGEGQFLITSLTFGEDEYNGNDPTISVRIRADDSLRARLTYGTPLNRFLREGSWWHEAAEGITLTVAAEQYRQVSTITNYTYNNSKFSTTVAKRWEF